MQPTHWKKLIWPTFALLVVLLPGWGWFVRYGAEPRDTTQRYFFHFFGVAIGVVLAWWIIRLIDVFVWELLARRSQKQIPQLLKNIVVALVVFLTGITIVVLVFKQSVAGLWATTGVVGLIVGLALRAMIADMFAGLAINLDQPYRIGQWVRVHARSIEPLEGRVREISWRCTRIQTKENTMVVIPNHLIATSAVVNCSEPETKSRFALNFHLALSVPTEQALRVLLAGARAAEGLMQDPPPTVSINEVTASGVEYRVRYWLEPGQLSPKRARHVISQSILDHLQQAGLTLARPQQDVYLARTPARNLESKLDRSLLR